MSETMLGEISNAVAGKVCDVLRFYSFGGVMLIHEGWSVSRCAATWPLELEL